MPSIFKKMAAEPTASVVLQLGRGRAIAAQQIAGIQNLVAGAVENLKADNVTVLDQAGKVLSNAVRNDDIGRSETQLALRRDVEDHLSAKAASMLDTVLGPGKSIVKVDATLNFEKIERQREIYDPAATVVRSEVRNESSIPSTGGTTENSTTNYEINKTVEHVISQTGGIQSLSVAVFVDGHYEPSEDGGEPVYTPLSDEELDQLKRVVERAVGMNATRGDQVEIVNGFFGGDACRYAFTFGHGRSLLDPGLIVRRFGMRIAAGLLPAERLSRVKVKEVSASTVFKNLQANMTVTFDRFGIDTDENMLTGIAGVPDREHDLYTRIIGTDAFYLNPKDGFQRIPDAVRFLDAEWRRRRYQSRGYDWIDQVNVVTDQVRRAQFFRKR